MARRQIICMTRLMRDEDPDRHISHVGIGDDQGWSRVLMVEEILMQLRSADGDRYFVRGRDGWEADVRLGKCPFCTQQHQFLISTPDLMGKDKLLLLPQCGE